MTFIEHEVTAMNPKEGTSSGGKGVEVSICSEKEMKMIWMHDTRIRLFMQMKLMALQE